MIELLDNYLFNRPFENYNPETRFLFLLYVIFI